MEVVVEALLAALPRPVADVDPRMLARAAAPGRVRDAALTLHAEARAHPRSADGIVRRGLRAARHLHSNERRLVADGVADLFRWGAALDAATGAPEPLARWLGWLVLHGLSPRDAAGAWEGDAPTFGAVVDLSGAIAETLGEAGPVQIAACVGSLSEALARSLVESLGEDTGPFLAASASRPPTAVRAHGIGRDALALQLAAEGIATHPSPWARAGLVVEGRHNLVATRAWRNGHFEIQDEASQVVAEVVDPRGVVVDFCAGAGGKSLAMLGHAVDRLLACDVRERPLQELRRRAARLPGPTPETVSLPAQGFPPALEALVGGADRVLVDAPCSGTGVLRRHPAYRLRLDAEELGRLPPLQLAILDRAAPLVRPGGRLVYATCSVLRAEDEAVVAAFLATHPDFAPLPLPGALGERAADLGGDMLRTLPQHHGTDGFFAAVLTRVQGGVPAIPRRAESG